jgi:hypothetical protein
MENNPNVPNHQTEYVYLYMCIYGPYNPRKIKIYIYIPRNTYIYIYNPRNKYIYILFQHCLMCFKFTIQFWGLEKWIHQLLGLLISSSPTWQHLRQRKGSSSAPVSPVWTGTGDVTVVRYVHFRWSNWLKTLFKPWWKPLTFFLVNPCRFKNHLLCQLNSFVDKTLYIYIYFSNHIKSY